MESSGTRCNMRVGQPFSFVNSPEANGKVRDEFSLDSNRQGSLKRSAHSRLHTRACMHADQFFGIHA